ARPWKRSELLLEEPVGPVLPTGSGPERILLLRTGHEVEVCGILGAHASDRPCAWSSGGGASWLEERPGGRVHDTRPPTRQSPAPKPTRSDALHRPSLEG